MTRKPLRTAALAATCGFALLPAADAAAVGPVTDQAAAIDPIAKMVQHAHDRAARRHVRLARTHAKLSGKPHHRTRGEVADWTTAHLTSANRDLKRSNRKLRRAGATTAKVAVPGNLQAIAACESGGNPGAVDASGTYRGKYQFDLQTWASVGGSGDPAAAPEAEQDQRAAMLYAKAGATPWPVCGS
jgi:hypothetical protein